METPSREQFVEQVIEITRAKFPLVKIARGEQAFSVRVNGNAASLENLYRHSTLNPSELKHSVERWMVELLRAAEGMPDEEAKFEQIKDRIFPMILTEKSAESQGGAMVTQSLVEDLVVAYAIDHDRLIAYIPRRHFDSWNITQDELHETAIANLVTRSEAISAEAGQDEQGRIYLIMFQTRDGYDSARILLPTLHERLREHLGSPFVAAIPHRDILLCFRNDEAVIEQVQEQITSDNRRQPHPITDRLLLITPDGIAPRS